MGLADTYTIFPKSKSWRLECGVSSRSFRTLSESGCLSYPFSFSSYAFLKEHRNFTLFLWLLLGVSTAVNTSLVIIWFEQCTPLKAMWDFRLDHPKCLAKSAIVGVAYLSAGMRSNLNEYYPVADIL